MNLMQNFARKALPFVLASSGLAASAQAQNVNPDTYRKTTQDFLNACTQNFPNPKMGFVGLEALDMYCVNAVRATNNPDFIAHRAYAHAMMAIHLHKHRPSVPDADLPEPAHYFEFAQKLSKLAINQGTRYKEDLNEFLPKVSAYLNSPVAKTVDPSPSFACRFNFRLPAHGNNEYQAQLVNEVNLCAAGYNEKPVGIMAFRYAENLHFLNHFNFEQRPPDQDMIMSARLARNFNQRAENDGFLSPVLRAGKARTQALESAIIWSDRLTRGYDTLLTASAGFAVTAAIATVGGAAIFRLYPTATTALKLTPAEIAKAKAAEKAAQDYFYFIWQQRMQDALKVAP